MGDISTLLTHVHEEASAYFVNILYFLNFHVYTIIVSTCIFMLLSIINRVLVDDSRSKHSNTHNGNSRRPNWIILNMLNYVVIASFVLITTYFLFNYKGLNAMILNPQSSTGLFYFPLAIVWIMCLTYFFGFFGISFLDTDAISDSPSNFNLTDLSNATNQRISSSSSSSSSSGSSSSVSSSSSRVNLNSSSSSHINNYSNSIVNHSNRTVTFNVPTTTAVSCLQAAECNNIDDIVFSSLTDEEVLAHLNMGSLKDYQLEKQLGDYERAVALRRQFFEPILNKSLDLIPYAGYDYNKVFGANCEIVIGYVPIPCGIVGPIVINGEPTYIPMATTEGCLVASTNRGCKAITASGGCNSVLLKDAITRAPCLRMPSALRAAAMKHWLNVAENYAKIEHAFNSTTSFGRLESIDSTIAGRNIYLRFCCMSGDAMGMNMVSKGCLKAIEALELEFPDLVLVAISGNMCTDKKPSAINWILGRGKSVVVEAIIPDKIVKSVLKSSVYDMIETNKQKNHIGSAMAGSIGGFNAHAANIVTALYLATGQDPAQNVESSNCLTIMELADDKSSLYVSCTMPSIEVGTVGGGTTLPAQSGCLDICGVLGAAKGADSLPGDNSRKLAQIVAGAVLAGELSLMAALAANHLVRSHMQHNRKAGESAPTAAEHLSSMLRKTESCPDLSKSREKGN